MTFYTGFKAHILFQGWYTTSRLGMKFVKRLLVESFALWCSIIFCIRRQPVCYVITLIFSANQKTAHILVYCVLLLLLLLLLQMKRLKWWCR